MSSPIDRNARAIFRDGVFRPDEEWLDGCGQMFNPGNYYNVGGNSKFYGAALIRYRKEDFGEIEHIGGKTPGWPISYDEIEKDYQSAEALYEVRGMLGEDATEPHHSGSYTHGPVADEADIALLRKWLKQAGLRPSTIPLGVDIDRWLAAGQTTWDASPNARGGKMDAETCGLAVALRYDNVSLQTGSRVVEISVERSGRVTGVRYEKDASFFEVSAPIVVLAAGAVQSAALLLSSANENYPTGVANSSDQVGRNFMNHTCSAVLA